MQSVNMQKKIGSVEYMAILETSALFWNISFK